METTSKTAVDSDARTRECRDIEVEIRFSRADPTTSSPSEIEVTADLIQLAIQQPSAQDELVRRFLPLLRRWARGRVPTTCRNHVDTDDLVQLSFIRALKQLEGFRSSRPGAFLAYLRRAFLNAMRDEIRRHRRRPEHEQVDETLADNRIGALEQLMGMQAVQRYERALAKLPERQREAVIMRVEFQYSFDEIATAIGSPSAKAAHMMVSRAFGVLAQGLHAYR